MQEKIARLVLIVQLVLIGLLALQSWRLYANFTELSSTQKVISLLANVGIDTQALVKREQSKDPEDHKRVEVLRAEITRLFGDLTTGNQAKNIRPPVNQEYREALSRLFMQWRKIEVMIEICRTSKQNERDLFMLSISIHHQSKRALEIAERHFDRITDKVKREKCYEFALLLLLILTSGYRLVGKRSGNRKNTEKTAPAQFPG